jgi:hypothetical protein
MSRALGVLFNCSVCYHGSLSTGFRRNYDAGSYALLQNASQHIMALLVDWFVISSYTMTESYAVFKNWLKRTLPILFRFNFLITLHMAAGFY